MDKRSNYTVDRQSTVQYEPHLSPYGRKVLFALNNLKKERRTNNNFKPILNPTTSHSPHRNKLVLRYETSKTLPICHEFAPQAIDNIGTSESNSPNRDTNIDSLSQVSSCTDLIKLPFNDISVTTENVCRKNVNYANLLITQQHSSNKENTPYNSNNYDASENISWGNMFESDILQYCEEADDDKNKTEKEIPLKEDLCCKTIYNNKNSKFEPKKRDKNISEKAKFKTKNVAATINMPKNNSSHKNNEKVNLRKEKYTTTVKNWLNDLNMPHVSDKDYIDSHQNQEHGTLTKMTAVEEQTSRKLEIKKIFKKERKNKRSIQTQLANKEGVMKFKKPKLNEDYNNNRSEPINLNVLSKSIQDKTKVSRDKTAKPKGRRGSLEEPNTRSETTSESNTVLIKEKKTKAKFVAPIKSQLPVKDVTYKVIIINSLIDMSAILSELEKIDVCEGVMTLVYSNGFCQLNRQHTDDACFPEGIMFCFQDTFYYIEGHVDGNMNALCRILSANTFISFDAKSVLVYFMCQYDFFEDSFNIIDTKVGSSLIRPDEPPETFSEMQQLLGVSAEYTIATECTLQKVAWYMTLLKECSTKLKCLLLEQGLWKVFADIEMKIIPILAGMEHRGICVDIDKLKSMEDILMSRMKEIEGLCHKEAGKAFQITSAAQVRTLIYDELKLDTASNVQIRETICKGAKSTSEAMLRSLVAAHPLPKLILEYRHLHKAHATFLAGIAQHVRDGVVRPTWNQTAAATGRIACSGPNLQAIPKMPFNLLLFPGAGDKGAGPALNLRSAYAARAGRSLLAADFRHVECRVFAHAAGDAALLAALRAQDLFRDLAAGWLDKPESAVSAQDRERTKRIVYASLYGAGARKLAELLGLGYEEVLSVLASFNRTFPALKSFGRAVVGRCARQGGRLATASGRARTFRNISSSDFRAKSQAERQAVNFVIQGTAADLCKMAMALSAERLRQHAPRLDAQLLLQIHDELLWEVPDQQLDAAAGIIRQAMEGCGEALGMPRALPVALYRGHNWGAMEPFSPSGPREQ